MLDDRDRYHPRTIEELAADPIPVTLINEPLPPDNVSTLGRAKQRSLHAVVAQNLADVESLMSLLICSVAALWWDGEAWLPL